MIWRATIWGQPPSLNHIYGIVDRTSNKGRHYKGVGKVEKARRYQEDAIPQIRVAKPSGWNPKGQIRVRFSFYLHRAADSDNLLKVINDAIQTATGVNDREYLSCVDLLQTGVSERDARVEIVVEDIDSSSPDLAISSTPRP